MRKQLTGKEFQQELLKKIKSKLSGNMQLSHAVAELLHISEATAYRRLSGEVLFSTDELLQLVQHYQLSVDDLLNVHNNEFLFSGHLMEGSSASFLNYLSNMGNTLQLVSENKGQLTCFNKDIPIFYQFFFPELAWFKYFFWQKHILLVPELQHLKFSLAECPKELLDAGYRIYYNYQRLDSTELWNIESIHTTLRQMVYSRQVREYHHPGDIDILLNQLLHVIETIKHQAEKGEKINFNQSGNDQPTGKSYKLYYNEFFLADNSYLVNVKGQIMGIINHSVINYIQTQHPAFNQYLQKHFENILSRSTLISGTNAKEREMFFNKLVHKIEQVKS